MNEIFKVAISGIFAAVCAVMIRKQSPELALLLALCAGVMILLSCSGAVSDVIQFMGVLVDHSGLKSEYFLPVIKAVGITLVTRVAAEMCKDAKEGALAIAVETAGGVLALTVVIPLALTVISVIEDLL